MPDSEFDPWATSIHGIKPMSPEEDAMWRRFEDYMTATHGRGWSLELDTAPTPHQRRARLHMARLGQAVVEMMTEAALEVLK